MDDREEPPANVAALGAVARGAAPGRDEAVVHHVLGRLGLAEDPVGERVGDATVAVVEDSERRQIAAGEGGDQGVVRQGLVGHPDECTEAVQRRMWRWGIAEKARKRSVPSELPPCPTAASMLSSLAVEPILDFLSDRL